jgi:hypothetical protein
LTSITEGGADILHPLPLLARAQWTI